MESFFRAFGAAAAGLAAQAQRLRVTAENIANADTPGYRRKLLTFAAAPLRQDRPAVTVARLSLSPAPLERIHDPAHPLAGPDGYLEGSNVELMVELADAREAQRSYEANLRMFDQARHMAGALIGLLRR
jgi:flagellar basal-body rod protein FlgC